MATRNFDFESLREGIVQRDLQAESEKLVSKWGRTGLLEGLSERGAHNMARLLENQAAAMLNEATTGADIIGFQNVAFPIVRRVFAGLIANELVSVQPMSLPSGLLFYLDYRYDTVKAGNQNDDFSVNGSMFGTLNSLADAAATKGFYNLSTSFSQREQVGTTLLSGSTAAATLADIENDPELSGNLANIKTLTVTNALSTLQGISNAMTDNGALKLVVPVTGASTSWSAAAGSVAGTDGTPVQVGTFVVYRRHTQIASNGTDMKFIVSGSESTAGSDLRYLKLSYVVGPTLTGGTSGVQYTSGFESDLNSTPTPVIPEVDMRIQSVAVTAETRKLKAKWTPELAQDLAAYQNLDAEVELTQVLSEAIALEIDREILADILYNATGANFWWSRKPGNFVDKTSGTAATGASFTGTVREWYETLIETIIDVANNIHRKTLRGAANFVVTSPDVATILEASVLYKPVLSMDPKETMFTVGTEKAGTLNSRFTVYKDPYFIRNKILVGYKGGSFLETGYVYAPYVPLIVTPTIYAPEDLTPRKGVMTRYAKKLVRTDFYGTVTVLDMNVI